jgi:predicted DNA binding CopG/RHH family protein
VSLRWLKSQVDVIKQAAAKLGIPYQTYIKQAAFRQALVDLKAGEVAIPLSPNRR